MKYGGTIISYVNFTDKEKYNKIYI